MIEGKDGLQYKVASEHDLIAKHLMANGEYEPEVVQIAANLIQHNPGCILDIGANIGTFVIPLANQFAHRLFCAFEVQPKIVELLKDNIALNKLTNVTVHDYGFAERTEHLRITVPDYSKEVNVGAFSLDKEVRENQYEVITEGEEVEIYIRPMDTCSFPPIGLIKMDVEGMELEVIAGGLFTLRNNNFPPLIFECWTWKQWFMPRLASLLGAVEQLGYKIQQCNNNFIAQHPARPVFVEFSFDRHNS